MTSKILEFEIPNNAKRKTKSSDNIISNMIDNQVNCSTDVSYTVLITRNTIGIDATVKSNSIMKEVPSIWELRVLDFFNNGYSSPSLSNVVDQDND